MLLLSVKNIQNRYGFINNKALAKKDCQANKVRIQKPFKRRES